MDMVYLSNPIWKIPWYIKVLLWFRHKECLLEPELDRLTNVQTYTIVTYKKLFGVCYILNEQVMNYKEGMY